MTFEQLLDQAIQRVNGIDFEQAVPVLKEHILRVNGPAIEELWRNLPPATEQTKDAAGSKPTIEQLAEGIASGEAGCIRSLPSMVNKIYSVINSPGSEPAAKVSLMGVLAYFVTAQDLMPDDQASAVGYVDDALIMFAMAREFLPLLQPVSVTEEQLVGSVCALVYGIPPERVDDIGARLNQLRQAYQLLRMTPPLMVNAMLQQLMANPQMLNGLANQSPYQGLQIPAMPPNSGLPYLTLDGIGGSHMSEPDGSSSVLFPGGGGYAMTDSGIVCWDD